MGGHRSWLAPAATVCPCQQASLPLHCDTAVSSEASTCLTCPQGLSLKQPPASWVLVVVCRGVGVCALIPGATLSLRVLQPRPTLDPTGSVSSLADSMPVSSSPGHAHLPVLYCGVTTGVHRCVSSACTMLAQNIPVTVSIQKVGAYKQNMGFWFLVIEESGGESRVCGA